MIIFLSVLIYLLIGALVAIPVKITLNSFHKTKQVAIFLTFIVTLWPFFLIFHVVDCFGEKLFK